MSAKHQRITKPTACESNASTRFDKRRFVSIAALDYYYSLLVDMDVIPERGILPHEMRDKRVADMIKDRRWENFVQQLQGVVVAVVRQFYANALEVDVYVVRVSGKPVTFDKPIINAYFHIRDMKDEDEFMSYRANDFHWFKALKLLCRPGDASRKRRASSFH